MTAAPARFTIDLDLAHRPADAAGFTDAERAAIEEAARAAGYADGLAAGEQSATATAQAALAAAAEAITRQAATLIAAADAAHAVAEREAIALASAIGRKLAHSLVTREPAAELEALLVDCLGSLAAVPHLVIRCHPELAGKLRDIATARIAESGFTGRLVVMGEPEIAPGDGRIEWAEGGLVRDSAAIAANIDASIAAYLDARKLPHFEETEE
jgi:flagellar assembly protein FliH